MPRERDSAGLCMNTPPATAYSLAEREKRRMEEKVLMTDANLRDSETEKGTGNAAQHLVEIDDDVGSTLLNILSYQMDTGKIAGSKKRVVSQGAQEIELAIVLRRQEIRTVKKLDRITYLILEELRNHPVLALAH